MTYQGVVAGRLAVPGDFPSAAMQRFGIRVAEFELDMLTVALDCFAADAELFCDLTNTVFGCNQRKDCHLTIAENLKGTRKIAITGKLVHGNGSDCSTGVDLACEHSLYRVHQLFH